MQTRTAIRKPERWAVVAAWGAFLVTVPSAVWRVLMIVGLMPGTQELRQFEIAGDGALAYGYVFGLSVVQLATGFLAVGLVRPWGERFLGRRVPLTPVVVVATLGGLAVVWIFDISMVGALLAGQRPDADLVSGVPLAVMVACYAPILLWGPLELLATVGYWLRRRRDPLGRRFADGGPEHRPAEAAGSVLPSGGSELLTGSPALRGRAADEEGR